MENARFEGLTRVAADTRCGKLDKDCVVIDNILFVSGKDDPKYWRVPASEIKSAEVSGNQALIKLTANALLGKGALRGKMAGEACITAGGGAPVRIAAQGGGSDDIIRCLIDPATNLTQGDVNYGNSGRGCTYWLNIGNGHGNPYRIDHGTNPAEWLNAGRRYSLVGMEINALLIVFDFPDAKAADNTGVVSLPGDEPKDLHNYVNGRRLKTAKDYFDWVSGRNIAFMDTASFGNVKTTWTLLENSEAGSDGIYTVPYSLYPNSYYLPGGVVFESDRAEGKSTDYPWLKTNPEGWTGYWFARGGSTDNWNSGVNGYASVSGLRRDFDELVKAMPDGKSNITMGYWAAVENAVGITYGQSFGGNGNIGVALGLDGTKDDPVGVNGPGLNNFSFMGADSYASFKYRHMTHELGHQMGLPDTYISGRTGYSDPYTGKSDTFSLSGGFDHMGQIIGIAPDFWAWVKWRYGWFRDDQVVLAAENGTYRVELTPVETEGGTKLVVIPGELKGVVYVLEYRGGKLGADNIAKTELSCDPFDPDLSRYGEQSRWDHKDFFGTDTKPGVLMYRINSNANEASPTGHTVVIDLLPRSLDNKEGYGDRYCTTLNDSLLGPASGVYEYSDTSFGVTISVDPGQAFADGAEDAVCSVTVTKKTPSDKGRIPVISNAEFVDQNTVQFTTNMDLRGLHPSNFRVIRGTQAFVGSHVMGYSNGANSAVSVNQMMSNYVRLTLPGAPFTYEDVIGKSGVMTTVEVVEGTTKGALFQYLPSASAIVAPNPEKPAVGLVTLTDLRFMNLTTMTVKADRDLSALAQPARGFGPSATGVAKSSLRITKPCGGAVGPEQIVSASYSRATGLVTINIAPGLYKSLSETIGTTLEIVRPVSSYNPGVTRPAHPESAGWYHRTVFSRTEEPAVSLMASVSGCFESGFEITGGSTETPIKTKLGLSFGSSELSADNVIVVEHPGGKTVKSKLSDWFAGFAASHKYNGTDEFPMAGKKLEFELNGFVGESGYTLTLLSPEDKTVWAKTDGAVKY